MSKNSIKNWSFGKLMAVILAAFVLFMFIAALLIKLVNSNQNKLIDKPATSAKEKIIKPIEPEYKIEKTANESTSNADIISIQINTIIKSIDQIQLDIRKLENKTENLIIEKSNQSTEITNSIIQEINSINGRIQALSNENYGNQSIEVIKNDDLEEKITETPEQSKFKYTPPHGFTVQATLGNRVWITDGKKEISLLINENMGE